jgi:uncharacterized protein YbgA (DUF1722 family)/uncharacterized protein YbbK (DUF523 family)
MKHRIQIGVSSCLLGHEVRHDGSHKRSQYISKVLAEYFNFVPFCPEMAAGLGVPRPAIRLVNDRGIHKLVETKNPETEYTDGMNSVSSQYCETLGDICGYILKSKSPSCGMERVNLYNNKGHAEKKGVGLFAQKLLQKYPNLPVEEEGRLNDPHLRENFIERVFAYHRWQQLRKEGLNVSSLMEFHQKHKFSLLAHDEKVYRQLGPLVASATRENIALVADEYIALFMQGMKTHATRKKHMNVLQHTMGFLKNELGAEDKQELLELLDKYKGGQVPLVVPVTLFRHHLRKNPSSYIEEQHYMSPYPEELMLRNHV